jgi:energy-coupling factor transport system permease protein
MLVTWHYRLRHSLMEKIDPRARWIFSLLMLVTISFFWDIRYLAFFFVLAFAWYFSARVPFRETRRAWMLVIWILLVMILVNTIITGGGAAGIIPKTWSLHPAFVLTWPFHFVLTSERLVFAGSQLLRVLAISAIFLIIPYSMDPRMYGYTFRRLGLPDRISFAMDLAFRYVPTLARDFGVTLDAQRARGYELERVQGGFIEQARKIAPLIVPVTMSSILTGEDVTNAMDLRCFGIKKRTWVETLEFHWQDYALIGASVAVFVASAVANLGFGLGNFWVWF